jgi:hypothetical protein
MSCRDDEHGGREVGDAAVRTIVYSATQGPSNDRAIVYNEQVAPTA